MNEDDILHRLEARGREQLRRIRAMLLSEGRPDLVNALDAKLRDIGLGIDGARSTWDALSVAQRRALQFAELWGPRLVRQRTNAYGCQAEGGTALWPIRLATVRNLCAREVMAWDGGAFDPESAAIVTERGRFVLKHGRVN